ncbi:hypothetical protein AB7M45_007755 [Bradyrhizobium elkanii]|uniref:hypothetical protein n=1 Tax=Bradyrhizobium elkanii TaxID=29448 RepID=UPI000F743563|nr:hypothetical protein [Bradyrhizobium elkanii]MCW2194982.1 hypothetical protein [Bradyrhizobium elkanii]NWL67318.1 hypothetical protein [Bradyrhizobium elkanii]
MTNTKERLEQKIGARRRQAGITMESPNSWQRFAVTAVEAAVEEIDALRASLEDIQRTATVGTLGPLGYEDTLRKIRDLVAQALAVA